MTSPQFWTVTTPRENDQILVIRISKMKKN